MLKLNGFTLLLCVIAFFQFQGTCVATTTPNPTTSTIPTTTTTSGAKASNATTNSSSGSVHNTQQGTATTAAPGKTTPDIGDACPGGSCKGDLICDKTCKIAETHDCANHLNNCQNGTFCINANGTSTCTVDAGFVGSACTNSTSCTVENSDCISSKCQCKPRYIKVPATLECKSGSATVMASVLVLAVAFVKTQLF